MSKVESKIKALGYELPSTPAPLAAYVPAKKVGNLVFTAGQLPMINGSLSSTGIVTSDDQIETMKGAAILCTLNALAAIKGVIGDLDKIKQVVRVVGYVSSNPGFTKQPLIINGASEILLEIFGESGKHARSAVGVAVLPLNASVEIELTVEI